jgi:hypothetical protein
MINSRKIRWAGNLALFGVILNSSNNFVLKPEGKRIIGRHGYRW